MRTTREDIRVKLVTCVKDEIKIQGVSQAWVARRAGITEKHMSQLMTMKEYGSMDVWSRIIEALDVRLEIKFVVREHY